MLGNPRSHVFLSYARGDGEAFARDIQQRLESENLTCWRDRLELEGGDAFWRQLEAGIADARWLLIVLTPAALESEWTAKEWREGRKRGIPICPVWCLPSRTLADLLRRGRLPGGMQRKHIYTPFPADDRDQRRADEEWQNLVATLRMEKDVERVPFMAPPLPPHYVDRPDKIHALLSLLLRAGGTTAISTALRGASGTGKTTLAKAIARRDEIVDEFHDGVLWVTLGTSPRPVELISDLCEQLSGTRPRFASPDTAQSVLAKLLENKRCLLILDDVWRPSDAKPFQAGDPLCVRLITTRVREVVRSTAPEAAVPVDAMTEAQAEQVLAAALPAGSRPQLAPSCASLARQLYFWPLLLNLAAGQIRARLDHGDTPASALAWAGKRLERKGVTGFEEVGGEDARSLFNDPTRRDEAVEASVGGSLTLLKTDALREAFLALGIFHADENIPLETAAQLWAKDEDETEEIAQRLADFALIELDLGKRVLAVHDHLLSYAELRLRKEGRWADTHRGLLRAWPDLDALPNQYAWRWVCCHLKEAGDTETLRQRLSNYDSIASRLQAVGINWLVSDYRNLAADPESAALEQALAQAAHVLAEHPDLLAQQILARLPDNSPGALEVRQRARASAHADALLPRTPSLVLPAGMLRQLVRHNRGVDHLVLAGNHGVLSGGEDGRVYCLSLEGGDPRLLVQHQGGISHLLLTNDGHAVSGGEDGRIYGVAVRGGDPVLLGQHDDPITKLLLAGDGRVLSGSEDGRVYCMSLQGGDPVLLGQHAYGVSQLCLTGDGRVLSGGEDGCVYGMPLQGGGRLLLGQHDSSVTQLLVAGDGRAISGGKDGRVYRLSLGGGKPVLLRQHHGWVSQLLLTGDGHALSAGDDGRVYSLSLDRRKTKQLGQHDGPVSQLLLTDDGRALSGGSKDGRVYCLSLHGGKPVLLGRHEYGVSDLLLTGDGRALSGGGDGRVYALSLSGADPVLVAEHAHGVSRLLLIGDGRALSGGSIDGRVYCLFLDGGAPKLLAQHEFGVSEFLLTGDRRALSSGGDGRVYCLSLHSVEPVRLAQHEGAVTHLLLTADRLVSGGADGRVYCLSQHGGERRLLAQHEDSVSKLLLTDDGRVLSAGDDGRIYCLSPMDGDPVLLGRHKESVDCLVLAGDGRALSGGADGRVYCLSLRGGKPVLLGQHQRGIKRLLLTGDGRALSVGYDRCVYCLFVQGGEPRRLVQHDDDVEHVLLTGDGRILSGCHDGSVDCMPLNGGKPRRLVRHRGPVSQLVLTGDGRVLSGGYDGCVYCMPVEGGKPRRLVEHESLVSELVLTGDGRVLSGGGDGRVYCVSLDGGRAGLLVRHDNPVFQLLVTKDGLALSGSGDGRVYCLPLQGGQPVLLGRHERPVSDLLLTGDGRVVSTSLDATLCVWDATRRRRPARFFGDYSMGTIAYDPVRRVIAAGDVGGGIHILDLPGTTPC